MTLRDTILAGEQNTQTTEQAKSAVLGLLTDANVVAELLRMRRGHDVGQADFTECSLSHRELEVALVDPDIRARAAVLEREGILAQFFDGTQDRVGYRGKSLKLAVLS